MKTTITCAELNERLGDGRTIVIDLLTPEDYALRRIPGARNACVYEMVFLDRIGECAAGKDCPLVIYDASGTTLAGATGLEKLSRAGYRDVVMLEGGLTGWEAAGFPVERINGEEVPVIRDGSYRVDAEMSVVEWSGRNINNRHYGRIAVAKGDVTFSAGNLTGGQFVLDMTSITNLDIQDPGWQSMLVRHLLSDDFFDVVRYPTASFRVTGYEPIIGATPGTPNGMVTGDLTIKEVTRPVTLPAVIAPQGDGIIRAQAAFDIDRTLWNVCYGSGKLYERLGMHLVHDTISLELFIVAR